MILTFTFVAENPLGFDSCELRREDMSAYGRLILTKQNSRMQSGSVMVKLTTPFSTTLKIAL